MVWAHCDRATLRRRGRVRHENHRALHSVVHRRDSGKQPPAQKYRSEHRPHGSGSSKTPALKHPFRHHVYHGHRDHHDHRGHRDGHQHHT